MERILPSTSSLPASSVTSPPAGTSVATITSYVSSLMEQRAQLIAVIEHDFNSELNALGQVVAQAVASVQQQLDRILGIYPNSQNVSSNTAVPQPGSVSTTTSATEPTGTQVNNQNGNGPSTVKPMLVGIDEYLWDPANPQNDINASNAQNWLKNGVRGGVPGGKSTDIAEFDPGNGLIQDGHGNADINWDQKMTFSTMHVGGVGVYTGTQTVNAGIAIELTGTDQGNISLDMPNASSNLHMKFSNNDSIFQVDNTPTITNMQLESNSGSGHFIIASGITKMAPSPGYSESLGVQLTINAGGILNYQNYNTLQLTSDIADIIHVKGEMDTYWGVNNQNTMIGGGADHPDDYIWVDGGVLVYFGRANIEDTITVPIAITGSGALKLSRGDNEKPLNGTLIVQGGNSSTNQASVWVKDSASTVQLSNYYTLECDNGYWQDNGTLKTPDPTTCSLKCGTDGKGTATIAGGTVWIDTLVNSYGKLSVIGNLSLEGELFVSIQGYAPTGSPGNSDELDVIGQLSLNQGSSTLYVNDYGQLQKTDAFTDFWIVIDDSTNNIQGDFSSESSNPQANLTYGPPNASGPGLYEIGFNG